LKYFAQSRDFEELHPWYWSRLVVWIVRPLLSFEFTKNPFPDWPVSEKRTKTLNSSRETKERKQKRKVEEEKTPLTWNSQTSRLHVLHSFLLILKNSNRLMKWGEKRKKKARKTLNTCQSVVDNRFWTTRQVSGFPGWIATYAPLGYGILLFI